MRFQSDSNIITLAATLLLATACKPKPPPEDSVEAVYPLREFLREAELIAEAAVESRDGDGAVFRVVASPKGACPAARFRLKIPPSSGFLKGESAEVLRHLPPGSRVVAFSAGNTMELYVNRFFVQAYGTWGDGSKDAEWGYAHLETRNNRTWNGSVAALLALLPPALEGRERIPPATPGVPAIDLDSLRVLPLPGQPVDEEYLPPPFRRGRPESPAARPPENPPDVVQGVRYEVFSWAGPATALDSLTPVSKGEAALPGSVEPASTEPVAVRYRGCLDVPADGVYFLILRTSTAAELSMGDVDVVRHEGGPRERGADVDLKAGRHAFTLTARGPVQLLWSGPGLAKQPVSAERLFRGK